MQLELLQFVDFICPNETEATSFTGLLLQLDDFGDGNHNDTEVGSRVLERARPLLDWFVHAAS